MWPSLAKFVLKYRLSMLAILIVFSGAMSYFASKAKLSYVFNSAIPKDNPVYKDYVNFKSIFGEDGNVIVVGVQSKDFFKLAKYKAYSDMVSAMKKVACVEQVLSVCDAVKLEPDSINFQLQPYRIFDSTLNTQADLQLAATAFMSQRFYETLIFNAKDSAFLMAIRVNKDSVNSPARVQIVEDIRNVVATYEKQTGIEAHLSGLPLIRTMVAERVKKEMSLFLLGSLLFSVLILLIFFRSVTTTVISMSVVLIGVVSSMALIHLCGYQITLLTALIPPLVVVIGIPNCIYFINKYHTSIVQGYSKEQALIDMVSKMGVVTLFCNITAAIGFAVFAKTESALLREFGVVAGISIMLIFVISFMLLPSVLSYLPEPKARELKYLDNKWIGMTLGKIETWVFNHRKWVIITTLMIVSVSVVGMLRLKSVGYIVDDLPKTDKIYTDLKFFEKHFKGIMPLEIMVDTKRKKGIKKKKLNIFKRMDSLSAYIAKQLEMNRPLSVAEGLKFATMGLNYNDSNQYRLPDEPEAAMIQDALKVKKGDKANTTAQLFNAFIDSTGRYTRMSINMADVGTVRLPILIDSIKKYANKYFDTSYNLTFTGSSVTFLEGSKYIIQGLKESIFWAFLLIALCMLYLFRSVKMLFSSLLPNLIPLVITAGLMGWAGIPLKPSTVLVFSVALGIAIDITIRFLVNYRQVLPSCNENVQQAVRLTVNQTGLSIIYTSLVLVAGFVIFCASSFGGTFALGWLTSLTLLSAMVTNLVFLPVLLILFHPKQPKY